MGVEENRKEDLKLLYSQMSKLTLWCKVLEARLDALDAEVGTLLEGKEEFVPPD